MNDEKIMCYITYAVPSDKIMKLPLFLANEETQAEEEFVPQWFNAGGFPEDDFD